jgi:Protein of unknown function (DUF3099)
MRVGHRGSSEQVHLVTQARRPLSEDVSARQRRYLIMMAIRTVCFVIAMVLFLNHAGWLTAIPAVGAIFLPYFAVVMANAGREAGNTRGFLEYHANLPARRESPSQESAGAQSPSRDADDHA